MDDTNTKAPIGEKLNEAETRANAERETEARDSKARAAELRSDAARDKQDNPERDDDVVDAMARVSLAVLQAEGHAHEVLNNTNPLVELRKMVAQRLYDPPAGIPDGAERLVYAVVDAMRQLRDR